MSQEKVRVTVYVAGGVVQHVDSPSFVEVTIVDYDNEDDDTAIQEKGQMKKAIELIETREGCAILEKTPRYAVMFRGRKFGELYFNMTGYTGSYLPSPGSNPDAPASLYVGERAISAYRKEIARLNRQWAAIDETPSKAT